MKELMYCGKGDCTGTMMVIDMFDLIWAKTVKLKNKE